MVIVKTLRGPVEPGLAPLAVDLALLDWLRNPKGTPGLDCRGRTSEDEFHLVSVGKVDHYPRKVHVGGGSTRC